MRITESWLHEVAGHIRREHDDHLSTLSDAEAVWFDYENLRETEFKGDLDWDSYARGITVLFDLPDLDAKVTMSPTVYLLASARLCNALHEGGITESFLSEHFPTLNPTEVNVELASVLSGVDAVKVGEIAVLALSSTR